jgi:hypothetical protein
MWSCGSLGIPYPVTFMHRNECTSSYKVPVAVARLNQNYNVVTGFSKILHFTKICSAFQFVMCGQTGRHHVQFYSSHSRYCFYQASHYHHK